MTTSITVPFERLNQFGLFRLITDKKGIDILHKTRLAFVFGDTGVLVTTNDDVYSIGPDNGWHPSIPNQLGKLDALCGLKIKDFSAGSRNSVVVITQEGTLYSWGNNDYGQLGRSTDDVPSKTPGRITGILEHVKVVQVCVSETHVLALSEEGKVFSWGDNGCGELGLNNYQQKYLPTLVDFFGSKVVKRISCSDSISAAVLSNGELYCWGSAGVKDSVNISVLQPRIIPSSTKFVQVCCALGSGCRSYDYDKRPEVYAISEQGILHKLNRGVNTALDGCVTCGSKMFMDPVEGMIQGTVVKIGTVPREDTKVIETRDGKVYIWGKSIRCDKPTLTRHSQFIDAFIIDYQLTPEAIKPSYNDRNPMQRMWEDKESADVTFVVEGEEVMAHKVILKGQSDYFAAMFRNEIYEESAKGRIQIKDVTAPVFKAMVEYLYTGNVDIPDTNYEDLFELRRIADKNCEHVLRDKCDIMLMKNLSVETCLPWLRVAVSCPNTEKMTEFAIKFILQNKKKILSCGAISGHDDLEKVLGYETYAKLMSAVLEQ